MLSQGGSGRPAFLKQTKKNNMTHFKLTAETKELNGITLYRIMLTEDHSRWGKADTPGGWVEKKENLRGDAWVADNAQVYGNARVYGGAQVSGNAMVYGNALICGNSTIIENVQVSGNAMVSGGARISGDVIIGGEVRVHGYVEIYGKSMISGDIEIC